MTTIYNFNLRGRSMTLLLAVKEARYIEDWIEFNLKVT
jgi:hypothetical protein